MQRALRLVATMLLLAAPIAVAEDPARAALGNWFNDPFFAVSGGVPGCPMPAGPRVTRAESITQSHHRSERGTRCWLAGTCDKPNSYAYDPGIAERLKLAFAAERGFSDTSLWVTVQGRIVYIEGCARSRSQAAALEKLARRIPDVEQVVVHVRTDPAASVPYRVGDRLEAASPH